MDGTQNSKGHELAWDFVNQLRGNEFKDMTLDEIDDFVNVLIHEFDIKNRL